MHEIIKQIDSFLWGDPFIYGTIAIGLFLTLCSGVFSVRHFGHIWKNTLGTIGKKNSAAQAGTISPFEALCVAVGGCVGTGNISGVAAAIAVGGPGALFWMWVYAILGMTIKTVEITLGCYYRSKSSDGEYFGGPTYYMQKGLKMKAGVVLAWVFGMFFALQWIVSGQPYAVAESLQTSFGIPPIAFLVFYAVLLLITINHGVSGIGRIASKAVPFMTIAYLLGGLVLIGANITKLPSVLSLIFSCAFTDAAAMGGFAGCSVKLAIQKGLSRAVNSNEAGQGTSPMVHAAADTVHPVRQGMWGAMEVFIDTIIVCSITGISILCTGTWNSGMTSVTLTTAAFESVFGQFGVIFVGLMMFLFGITTNGGWYSYYNTLLNHALQGNDPLRKKATKVFKYIYPLPCLIYYSLLFYTNSGANMFWDIVDMVIAIPVYFNLITLLMLSGTFFKLLKDYKARYMNIGQVDPNFKYFYETEPNEAAKAHDKEILSKKN